MNEYRFMDSSHLRYFWEFLAAAADNDKQALNGL